MTSEDECPYGAGSCPRVINLEQEVHEIEDDLKTDVRGLYEHLDSMKKTLYVIAGILFAELGVTIL